MTRLEYITQFILKARALDAVEEEAFTDPKNMDKRRKNYSSISVFDIHVLLLLAKRGDGGTITTTDTHLERRQFPKSAESALDNLRALAARGYIRESNKKFSLNETGIRYVNAVIS